MVRSKKQTLLSCALVLFCGCDESLITVFEDNFARADTTYDASDRAANLGTNYRAYSDGANASIRINGGRVECIQNCRAEYVHPMTSNRIKMSVAFDASNYTSTDLGNHVSLSDAASSGGCQVSGGYFANGSKFVVGIVDKATASLLAQQEYNVPANIGYTLEFTIDNGSLQLDLFDPGHKRVVSTSAGYPDPNCMVQEPSFAIRMNSTADLVYFDKFKIEY